MSKKVKILVSVLVAVVLLTVGGVATVMAQEPTPSAEDGAKRCLTRVAEILGVSPEDITNAFKQVRQEMKENAVEIRERVLARATEILGVSQEDLSNAFKQAQQEMKEGAVTRALDKAVEKELITQEEADQIKEWWEQKPEVLDQALSRHTRALSSQRLRLWARHRAGLGAILPIPTQ